MHRCAGGLWLQGHTERASLLCSIGKIFHCVHYLSAAPRRCNNNGLLLIPISSTCFGQLFCPKHVELTGIITKLLLLHLVGCLYYLYEGCTVKKISDNEIYLLIKYIKSVLWRVAKRLSYIENARCLKIKGRSVMANLSVEWR